MSAFLSIGIAVALAALKFTAERLGLQLGRNLFARGETRTRRTSLLQPSQSMTEAHVRALKRVPVEPRLKASGRLGIWRRLRLLNLRPSTPKPILLLAAPPVEETLAPGSGPWGLDLGGSRLILKCHPSEDSRHLRGCIRAGGLRTAKTVANCSIAEYFGKREAIKTYAVAWHRVRLQRKSDDTVIAYGPDSLYTAVDTEAQLAQLDDSCDVVWLLHDDTADDVDTNADAGDAPPKVPCDACGNGPGTGRGLSRRERFPWRVLRATRAITATILAAAAVPLTIWWYSSINNPSDLDLGEQLTGIPIAVLWYLVLILSLGHWLIYAFFEARPPRPWPATTTRCFDDGKVLRNGYFRSLCRCRRFA